MPILVSACLLGLPTRYDGKDAAHPRVLDLAKTQDLIPVCPEQLAGLPTPRLPCERMGDKVLCKDGQDLSEAFKKGAELALKAYDQHGCTYAILKSKSPACGIGRIYDGSFSGSLCNGHGVFAERLLAAGINIEDETGHEPDSAL